MGGPFTLEGAARHGVTSRMLSSPVWRQLLRGVWIYRALPVDRTTWCDAARLIMPDSALLCGLSAVSDLGIDVRARDDMTVHVGCATQPRRSRAGIDVHLIKPHPGEICRRGSWLVTVPARTALDCARWLTLVESTVVVDALIHGRWTSKRQLLAMADAHRGEKGSAALRRGVSLADGRAESPMETRQRLVLTLGGLPFPESQYEVYDAAGRFVARLDLAYVSERVAIEFDGAMHWAQRRSDDRRRDRLRSLDWIVLVFSADDIYRAPERVVQLVAAALASRHAA